MHLHKLYCKQRWISTGNKKLSTFFPQKQAKKGDFSVLSRIFLLHRQENLRKGLTIGEKFDKIQTDHIRTIWRIGIIRSAGARHAGRESAVQRICVLRRNRRRGRCVLCSAVFFPLLRPRASALAWRKGKGPAGKVCGSLVRWRKKFPEGPRQKSRGRSGLVLRFSRNPVIFYGETLDKPQTP